MVKETCKSEPASNAARQNYGLKGVPENDEYEREAGDAQKYLHFSSVVTQKMQTSWILLTVRLMVSFKWTFAQRPSTFPGGH